jgi:glutamate N-acetyltransferase/amino-acid N-acetyltransferase
VAKAQVARRFTRNRFCAAPVQLCRQHWPHTACRSLVHQHRQCQRRHGEDGPGAGLSRLRRAGRSWTRARAGAAVSTGVIMEALPTTASRGLPAAIADLKAD